LENVPQWLIPVFKGLQEKASLDPAVIRHGVFDIKTHNRVISEGVLTADDIVIGINHGFGKFAEMSFYINREPMGSNYGVVCFNIEKDGADVSLLEGKCDRAFEEAPSRTDEIIDHIWGVYVAWRGVNKMPRLSVVT